MASVIVEDMIDQYPQATPEEFVEILASQLSNGRQATDFISRIQGAVDETSVSRESDSQDVTSLDVAPVSEAPAAGTLSPEFLSRCRQTLMRCIGPMANYLVDDTLADFPNLAPQELVTRLAAEIPDRKKADDFCRQMQ
jgi:serine/threonine-protein kinase